jgi:hypothetical protein
MRGEKLILIEIENWQEYAPATMDDVALPAARLQKEMAYRYKGGETRPDRLSDAP